MTDAQLDAEVARFARRSVRWIAGHLNVPKNRIERSLVRLESSGRIGPRAGHGPGRPVPFEGTRLEAVRSAIAAQRAASERFYEALRGGRPSEIEDARRGIDAALQALHSAAAMPSDSPPPPVPTAPAVDPELTRIVRQHLAAKTNEEKQAANALIGEWMERR